ncbi:MAG: AI-2E family transporter [Thermodesulfobacteriota bacterium]
MKKETLVSILFAALIGYLSYRVLAPFFIPIFWAAVFVILFYPFYAWLLRRVKIKAAASALACFIIALFFLVPMSILAAMLTSEVLALYSHAQHYAADLAAGRVELNFFFFDYLQRLIERYVDVSSMDLRSLVATTVQQAGGYVVPGLRGAVGNFAQLFFNIVLAFFTMFFLFIESDKLVGLLKDLMPLDAAHKEEVITKNRVIITATLTGGVLVGAVQGALGGLAFWFLGISSPFLWGFVMFITSFLPGIGTLVVVIPAILYLLIKGAFIKALLLLLWGALVIGLVDNLLRPIIISGKTNQHPLMLFFSVLGAVQAFGFIGIIAGPIILSLAMGALEIFRLAMNGEKSGGPGKRSS